MSGILTTIDLNAVFQLSFLFQVMGLDKHDKTVIYIYMIR